MLLIKHKLGSGPSSYIICNTNKANNKATNNIPFLRSILASTIRASLMAAEHIQGIHACCGSMKITIKNSNNNNCDEKSSFNSKTYMP
jgi:hypothetical protein